MSAFRWLLQMARTFLWPSVPVDAVLSGAIAGDDQIIQRVFEWERDRIAALAKGFAGAASGIGLAALAAGFDGKQIGNGTVMLVVGAVLAMLTLSAVLTVGEQTIGGQYAFTVERLLGP